LVLACFSFFKHAPLASQAPKTKIGVSDEHQSIFVQDCNSQQSWNLWLVPTVMSFDFRYRHIENLDGKFESLETDFRNSAQEILAAKLDKCSSTIKGEIRKQAEQFQSFANLLSRRPYKGTYSNEYVNKFLSDLSTEGHATTESDQPLTLNVWLNNFATNFCQVLATEQNLDGMMEKPMLLPTCESLPGNTKQH